MGPRKTTSDSCSTSLTKSAAKWSEMLRSSGSKNQSPGRLAWEAVAPNVAVERPISVAASSRFSSRAERERNIIDHVQAVSPRFLDGIRAFSNSPIIGEIRGIGLVLGMTFSQNKSPNDIFPSEWRVGRIFGVECKKRGLLVHDAEKDTIVLSPPLVISSKEVDELISIFGEALKSTEEKVEKLQADKKK